MSEDKITYDDVEEHEMLFKFVPSFLLERFAKNNTNLVLKFGSRVRSFMGTLNDTQKKKLSIVLDSDVEELQSILADAYSRTNIKQYAILANPDYRQFIEINIDEMRKIVNNEELG